MGGKSYFHLYPSYLMAKRKFEGFFPDKLVSKNYSRMRADLDNGDMHYFGYIVTLEDCAKFYGLQFDEIDIHPNINPKLAEWFRTRLKSSIFNRLEPPKGDL